MGPYGSQRFKHLLWKYTPDSLPNFLYTIIKCMRSWKQLATERNRPKFGSRGKYLVYAQYFQPLYVQGQSEVTRCIYYFRQPCISKKSGHRAKRIKIWALWVSTFFIQSTFSSLSVQGHAEVIRCFSVFNSFLSQMAGCREKHTKIWGSRTGT